MKKNILIFVLYLFYFVSGFSQKITYSPLLKKETINTDFKIIGRNGNNFLVYKNNYRRQYITYYNEAMEYLEDVTLDDIPEKALNVEFLNQKDKLIVIYQYQKSKIVYCDALIISQDGKKISDPVNLDTTSIGYFSENNIYGTSFSEDKNLILIYKQNIKNGTITLATKLFDQQLNLLESSRTVNEFNQRKEEYSDCYVDNEGNFVYTKERRKNSNRNIENIDLVVKKKGIDTAVVLSLPLESKFIDVSYLKVDNLNKNYLVNAFYYNENRGHIQGLYTVRVPFNNVSDYKSIFNTFSSNMADEINSGDKRYAIDDLQPQQMILKKNGGFLLVSESFYSETMNNYNTWNRNYYGSYPYSSYDYLPYNPFGYSQFWNNYNRTNNTRYFYNDIMVTEVDSSSQLTWSTVIHKSQADVNRDDFLSYGLLNSGGEIQFLYIDNNNKKEIVSRCGIKGSGDLQKYATLKSNERGYEFMPKLSKQVGYSQLIIPFVYSNNLGFAKIDFSL